MLIEAREFSTGSPLSRGRADELPYAAFTRRKPFHIAVAAPDINTLT
jgi:hypothetical protein